MTETEENETRGLEASVARDVLPRSPPRDLSLCWFAALAWICTRDDAFTMEVQGHLTSSTKSFGEAKTYLYQAISSRCGRASEELQIFEMSADKELVEGLVNCGIEATYESPADGRQDIDSLSWTARMRNDKIAHDSVLLLDGSECEQFDRVSLKKYQVLARWSVDISWLAYLLFEKWDSGMLAYWVKYRSFLGFSSRKRTRVPLECTDDLAFIASDMVLREIRAELQSERLTCTSVSRANGSKPANARALPREFWAGHSLREVSSATFDRDQILRIWPAIAPRLFKQFESQQQFIKQAVAQCDCSRANAEWLAKIFSITPGARGPKPKAQ